MNRLLFNILFVFIFSSLISCGPSKKKLLPNPISDKSIRSNHAEESALETNKHKNLYWGDLHLHTSLSVDAFIGGTLTSADQAYEFAKGNEIEMFKRKASIRQPLDFCAVTDHAEMLGEMYTIQYPEAKGHGSLVSRYFRSIYREEKEFGVDTIKQRKVIRRILEGADGDVKHPWFFKGYETTKSAWQLTLEAAERHNSPGEFTTFAGYEWTMGGGITHMHRNIIFRDMMVPDYPVSSIELTDEEQLWIYLQGITDEGATVMAIPHNSNFSNGGLFTENQINGKPYDSSYAQLRQDFEPVAEIHQAKGNSEVHALLWKNDEFADFENYSANEIKKYNYLRYVLEQGLKHEEHLGINPFKFGMIGSTDTHNGTPGNTEENDTFIGNGAILDLMPEGRRRIDWPLDESKKVYEVINPGGLVAVWAEANTRGHIYDALKRKEVYATSGNRIQLRFFAGQNFKDEHKSHDAFLKDAYENGIPMGGDIVLNEEEKPEFLVWTVRDEYGATLDRIQIIKAWFKNDSIKEEIYNVKLSDNRVLNEDGSVPDNGAKVNMETGVWSKGKGDDELMVYWIDEDFDPAVRCFYYVRVLEVPTASWRLWDQIRYDMEYPEAAELVIQERAWSSPIWYSPK